MLVENPGGIPLKTHITVESTKFFNDFTRTLDDEGKGPAEYQRLIAICSLLIINTVFYTNKVALELNYGISRFQNLMEMISLCLLLTALIVLIMVSNMKQEFVINFFDPNTYIDLSLFVLLDEISRIGTGVTAMFYPFRLFLFISHFEFSSQITSQLNTFGRVTPGLTLYFVVLTFSIVGFAMSLSLIFSPHLSHFRNFEQTLVAFASRDVFNSEEYERFVS